tara:strand:+ start:381 stop:728 length:348 start_codon:yes stop_codon:yes gene_type:complete
VYNYSLLAGNATALLQKFGKQYTFTRTTNGAYSPSTGTTSQTTATFDKYACVFDYTTNERAAQSIEQNDRRLLAEGHAYEVGDTVSIASEIFRVISVSEIKPSDVVVACNLQIRK